MQQKRGKLQVERLIDVDDGPFDDYGKTVIAKHFMFIDQRLPPYSVTYTIAEIIFGYGLADTVAFALGMIEADPSVIDG